VVTFGLRSGRALFMVESRTMRNIHIEAIIGDVVPRFTPPIVDLSLNL
jgi:hypothetical protein